MVYFKLKISATMDNVASIEPMGGVKDPSLTYHFQLHCEGCGELSETHSCVSEDVVVFELGREWNLIQKCKLCNRRCKVEMIPLAGARPLTAAETAVDLKGFEFHGMSPVGFNFFGPQWKVPEASGYVHEDVDLSNGCWTNRFEDVRIQAFSTSFEREARKKRCSSS